MQQFPFRQLGYLNGPNLLAPTMCTHALFAKSMLNEIKIRLDIHEKRMIDDYEQCVKSK